MIRITTISSISVKPRCREAVDGHSTHQRLVKWIPLVPGTSGSAPGPAPGAELAGDAAGRFDDRWSKARARVRGAGCAWCRRPRRWRRRRGRRESWIGAATLDSPSTASSRSRASPDSRTSSSSLRSAPALSVRWVSFGERLRGEIVDDPGRRVGEHRLAERAGVGGQLRADLEHLEGGVGPEDVVDHDHGRPVQDADADGRLRAGWRAVRRGRASARAARCGRGRSCRGAGGLRRAGTCPSRGPARRSRAPAASGAARGPSAAVMPELVGELRHAEPPRPGGQRLEDPRRAVDGLDRAPRAAG